MRPAYLRRIGYVESRMEYEDDTVVDPSHTFGPSKGPSRSDIRIVRALALYVVVFWLAIGGAALWCWPQ